MRFYFVDDFEAAGGTIPEPEAEAWISSSHENMGTALNYLLASEKWAEQYFKEDDYAIWDIDKVTSTVSILFSNYKLETMFRIADVKSTDISDMP